ncbi:MAG: polyprenyl synthetase family protein [Christensenellales bacterium]|jgi:geranylgeranyl diphosphate synthase type II
MVYEEAYLRYCSRIDAELMHCVPETIVNPLGDAMRYSLLSGGKRLRPVLCLAANEMAGGEIEEALGIACGIEMIHAYSLIHDDLPAMDDDELRRGKPTCHVVFGEAMAILAGDGLLNTAFEHMCVHAMGYPKNIKKHLQAILCVARYAGIKGMVAGQCLDLEAEGRQVDEKELLAIHSHKTGALITAPLQAGLILAGAREDELSAIKEYGENLGLCFQIMDDVLDVVGDVEKLGKSTGKDDAAHKMTFPKLYGLEKSREMALACAQKAAKALLDAFGDRAEFLRDAALRQVGRER